MPRKRKQPIPKNKNARKSNQTNSLPQPCRERRGSGQSISSSSSNNNNSSPDIHVRHFEHAPATIEAMLASRTTGTKQKRKPKQKPKRNPKKRDQKWEPMAHTCAVCETKTTSAGFKRTCFEKHEFVCVRFHKTLLRAGKTGSCSACVQEEEMDKRRIRDLEIARRALEEIAAALEACVKRKRGVSNKFRNAVRRVEELEVEIVKARLTTDEGLRDREAGFLRWRSS